MDAGPYARPRCGARGGCGTAAQRGHVLPEETPNFGLNPRQPQNPLADYLDSLTETARIDPQQVFPGHGEPLGTLHT